MAINYATTMMLTSFEFGLALCVGTTTTTINAGGAVINRVPAWLWIGPLQTLITINNKW